MKSLHRFLIDYDMAMLRAVAGSRGITLTTNRQAEAVDQLAVALLDPLSVRVALAHLSPQGQLALDTLLAGGGRMRAPQFDRRFGHLQPIGPGRLERETAWQNPANPAEELRYGGLAFRAFSEDEAGPGEFVFVPDDLLPLLPQPEAGRPFLSLETVPPPARTGDDGAAFVQDLFVYLVYVQTREVRPYADGRLASRDLANLRARLADPDDRRLALLRHLAERLGFVARKGEALRLEAMPAKRWLTASLAEQVRAVQQVWSEDPTWVDLCHVPGLICDADTGWLLRYDAVATRQALLALLARCPLDGWWSLVSFVEAVKEANPDFQRPDGDYTSWYIRDAADEVYLSGFESWDRIEGALLADLLTGPLRWLGIVAAAADLAGPGQPRRVVCRLTEVGARFLGLLAAEPPLQISPPLVIRPDFCIELPTPVNLYTRFQLERFADLESGEPCRYLLTVGALGRALARGVRVEQVLAFLQQSSGAPVPANVAGQLRLWAGRFGQAEVEEVAVLRVKNERVLRELTVLPQTRSLIGQLLTATTALIDKRHVPRLRQELAALGYLLLPSVTPPSDAAERG